MNNYIVFGGSFNPPHLGHEYLINEALKQLNNDATVIIIPSYKHPYNKELIDFDLRLQMCKLAFRDSFIISDIERKINSSRTSEVICELKKQYKGNFYLLLGKDCISDICNWYNSDFILNNVFLIARNRINISSTKIREKIISSKMEEINDYLNKDVANFIIEYGLYQENNFAYCSNNFLINNSSPYIDRSYLYFTSRELKRK